jgi:glycosyltransferase involved in cell wall biosynthesis
MSTNKIEVSIIVPLKNEAENIEPLAAEISQSMDHNPWNWECLWIDDGSTDNTLSILKKISGDDSRHRFMSFEKNSGQSAAFYAGFREAKGTVIATIDGDGQNDPADLPSLVNMIYSGKADMVNGYRLHRQDSLIRKLSSKIANGFRNLTTGKTVKDVGCSTRVFKRECIVYLPKFSGLHRFIPTLVEMEGFELAEVPVNHRPRLHGKTKYNITNRLWVGLFDSFGVFWLKKRAFHFTVKCRS